MSIIIIIRHIFRRSFFLTTTDIITYQSIDLVARMGRREAYTGFRWRNLRERDRLGKPGGDGRIILRWIFRKWDVGLWTGSNWLRIGAGGGYL
jgi:hypothetical protein